MTDGGIPDRNKGRTEGREDLGRGMRRQRVIKMEKRAMQRDGGRKGGPRKELQREGERYSEGPAGP